MSIVVTGATSTMTSLYVQKLVKREPDSKCILFVRQPDRVAAPLPPANAAQVEYRQLELEQLAAVRQAGRKLADDVKVGEIPPIKTLLLSAAIQHVEPSQPHITDEGYEATMAVCHLAHYILLRELVGSLEPRGARVIIVGSAGHSPTYAFYKRKTDWKPLDELLHPEPGADPPAESIDYGQQRYGNAKLAQMMTGHELARRLSVKSDHPNVSVIMFNPGSMSSGLQRSYPYVARKIISVFMYSPAVANYLRPGLEVVRPSDSAETLLKMTVDPAYGVPGRKPKGKLNAVGGAAYFDPQGKEIETEAWALDVLDCRQLWVDSAKLLGYPEEL